MGRLGPGGEFPFGKLQVEQPAVVGEELNANPAKHGFEIETPSA